MNHIILVTKHSRGLSADWDIKRTDAYYLCSLKQPKE